MPTEIRDTPIGPPGQRPAATAPAPLNALWDGVTTFSSDPDEPTVVHLTLTDGRPVDLLLDSEHREELGLMLVNPSLPDVETDDPYPPRRRPRNERLTVRRRRIR
ncbi:hypothetical protein OG618_37255 (plasmid) [Kitasatospora sp. NBC_01246]|uniref:hypothetical protein n=1 Tax=Kitasatospora sp. NBC_01246 TaxID=2903570 RepID=UPI002E37602F|nr:hypothetical protein [Kitasatospora sp. NBC_01246]